MHDERVRRVDNPDAMYRGYTCILLSDCTAEPIGAGLARSNHEASLLLIQTLFGWVSTSEEVIDALNPARSASKVGGPVLSAAPLRS